MTDNRTVTAPSDRVRGLPVSQVDFSEDTAIYGHYDLLNQERERSRFLYNNTTDRGFFMLQRYDDVQAGLQRHKTWSVSVRNPMRPNNSGAQLLLPNDLDGEEHRKLRKILNPFFAPAAVRRLEPLATEHCIKLIDELRAQGECDFVQEFAIRYPTDLFIALLGLPLSDGEKFLAWSDTFFNALLAGEAEQASDAKDSIISYFEAALDARESNPGDPDTDLVTRLLLASENDDIARGDVPTILLTLMLAGLDTTRSALGYMFAYLANNQEDRQEIIDDPDLVPNAVEEFLRMNPLVYTVGREVQTDQSFDDLELRRGDVMWLGLAQANRDPRKFENPDSFMFERPGVNQHIAFGGGPHRCLGMHLARMELQIALEQWHERIPDYWIKEGAELVERGPQLSIKSLPLEWKI